VIATDYDGGVAANVADPDGSGVVALRFFNAPPGFI
jgi:hypothetical protein